MISSIQEPNELRKRLQGFYRTDEKSYARYLVEKIELSADSKNRIYNIAKQVVEKIKGSKLDVIDSFMQQYSLSSDEGVALMCLAESLLRIPDDYTIDELIKDKIANQEWSKHLGRSSSLFVNASTWSLMIGSSVLRGNEEGPRFYHVISKLLKNFGEPIIRKAVKQAMLMLGKHFIVGETIEEALESIRSDSHSKFLCSFSILGEAAHTAENAEEYFNSYMHAIKAIGESTDTSDCFKSHGISIKFSSLHPRYEFCQFGNIAGELKTKVLELCHEAKKYNISLCIDAEESERLEMSLVLFEQLRLDESLSQWEGLGLAVQAYQKRALSVLDFVEDVAIRSKHKIMVRLVKGAYWDSEIKRTQELGLSSYPVFTRKSYTDVCYLACARKLLSKASHFYPCFGTHNAYTFATIVELADKNHPGFEFQRLHGIGKNLYDYAMSELATSIDCRIYAPVGKHSDLLPYLIRRLLENGANSSFVNQINGSDVKIEELISDPLEKAKSLGYEPHSSIPLPQDIFGEERKNSLGMDIGDSVTVSQFANDIKELSGKKWQVGPIINGESLFDSAKFIEVVNPAHLENVIGEVSNTTSDQALNALEVAHSAFIKWQNVSAEKRTVYLEKAADLLEEKMKELIYILIVEAGKVLSDAITEVREAVDFLRYYAIIARNELSNWKKLQGPTGEDNFIFFEGRGVFLCISPWNFPLAIFIGQVSAALAAGNAVLAKPAEQTPIIAYEAVKILHEAGIPKDVLHLIPGDGQYLGKALVPDNRISGVAFTGSTQTAQMINRMLASRNGPIVPFIAETGGLNAMIVDSSALLEQVTVDVLLSAFRSAGQRCSALKVLFIQEDIAEKQIKMICDAAQELKVGDPIQLSTDIGPIIDKASIDMLTKYTEKMSGDRDSSLLSKVPMDTNSHNGHFFSPYIYEIQKISQLKQEVFGPILHIIRFNKSQLNGVISDINNTGYGLTFSLQSRIQNQIDSISRKISVGNVYINRDQVGATVGVQPFGGRGLSGTGPKAGGPNYLQRFSTEKVVSVNTAAFGGNTKLMCLD
ncbi:bifunctional proline dehydrogenase/L-glutamate gamma-semialdehyde dehydrogenase PutA [Wolbachia endosymbiont of Brugia malayi]|uniref:bifunctional proline dehydrogenase/L-glutamate gamma-semialdehyde dehydrogenase PutA n=1 Tax=Wolbachia endosymbiont of Brugia malayi TaxID=80849 RepID=UPI00004C9427|nr:bifunctional proline dehydrogenase/L-glutamate gamma-semialdehyde dehydrogenase PutA [Wolbachia endosymbiont of Brugia malayi]AAW71127.1 Proline dehydrogenase, P5C dehydrogenase, PutA ortholog [Wolbachia endosymbiont strain TRS of Brugia malayi]QCB61333.1 bifunctional proline dehydrogenase/L-glutamate gamma-semialdehyde dehydrogenase PutA [Wolbachia endosymbiont of Brugia malayi]